MSTSLPPDCPPEFDVDTSGGAPLDDKATLNRLHDLLQMRDILTQFARKAYDAQTRADEKVQTQQRQTRKVLQTMVLVIDELRRLVEDARRNQPLQETMADAEEPESSGPRPGEKSTAEASSCEPSLAGPRPWWWPFGGGRSSEPSAAPSREGPANGTNEWLNAFCRLLGLALNKLESLEIHHVPLLGQDLKTLTYEGQSVKSWVSIKNRAEDGQLVVKEEIRGLWVSRHANQVTPVLNGEVLV
jgi:hypothetical protein